MNDSSNLQPQILERHLMKELMVKLIKPIAALAALLLAPAITLAADLHDGWGAWWLPPDRSNHGHAIDSLFVVTFWITMVTFVAVQICLIVFLIKYRWKADKKKAVFTHGNTRLEMAWTLAPALILAGLAVANKGAWDKLRFNPDINNPQRATILVIGEQFKWNVIYPGPDGKLGRYLLYPRPTDTRWSGGQKFANVAGPAELPYEQAKIAINSYIAQVNPLGKDFDDPDGKDDNFEKSPGREINIPANRPTEVQLSSKDVIHDFFLPNFRVKLDAVPGMRGKIVFTANMTSREREEKSRRTYKLDELLTLFSGAKPPTLTVVVTRESPGASYDDKRKQGLYVEDPKAAKPKTIIRDGGQLTKENVEKLKTAGVTEVVAYERGHWEIVCEELCGQGHATMTGQLVVLDPNEFNQKFEGGRSLSAPTTKPAAVAVVK